MDDFLWDKAKEPAGWRGTLLEGLADQAKMQKTNTLSVCAAGGQGFRFGDTPRKRCKGKSGDEAKTCAYNVVGEKSLAKAQICQSNERTFGFLANMWQSPCARSSAWSASERTIMVDTSRSQEQTREAPAKTRHKERPRERTQDAPAEQPTTNPQSLSDAMGDKARKGKAKGDATPAIKVEQTVATAGKAGEKNITVKWLDIWIGNYKPCYFDVATLPGHGLEVTIEQLAYKKTYTGTGSLTTQPVPVVPIGTTFTIVSRDTTTGEVLEQHGIVVRHERRGRGNVPLGPHQEAPLEVVTVFTGV